MTMTQTPALDELAERMGIEPEFHNVRGELVCASADTKRRLLAALGTPAPDEPAARMALDRLRREEWTSALPPVAVLYTSPISVDVTLRAGTDELSWTVALEDGTSREGRCQFGNLALIAQETVGGVAMERRRLVLPGTLPHGYHRLSLQPGSASMTLIATPGRCWLPDGLVEGHRLWGVTAQLYLLRSATDWGIGDYGDLRSLIELTAPRGAEVVGLNPLHAMFTDNPEHASPYSPASRLLLNVLNIDVQAVPELLDCKAARDLIASEAFRARLEACRSKSLVDYTEVTALKLKVLELLFGACRAAPHGARWRDFEAFRRMAGESFERGCLFLALREHFASRDPSLAYWRAWPEGYRNPASEEVRRFATEHADRVTFAAWLQWIADGQLGSAAALCRDRGMSVGLYRDLAVGADNAGAETWANAAAVISGLQVGAPPDIFNPAGQDWGLPPFHPRALRAEGYRSFIELARANMRHAGALRIDHVMGLLHLFCIPAGEKPSGGAYIRYPLDDLVGILALESQRLGCLVVGEDLGTVPPGFRERMAAANILSYRILFFEQEADGTFLPPEGYPAGALAVLGSHDLPTFRGWWEGRDIDLKERYGLLPTAQEVTFQRDLRRRDKAKLLEALRQAGLIGGDEPGVPELSRAAHALLARTRSGIATVQIDDMMDEPDQVNVPSTSLEHPNWRRRMSATLEELPDLPGFTALTEVFRADRPSRHV